MAAPRTGSLESLRARNRLRVVEVLRRRGAVSRAEVARATGLSRSTVSSLVADLQRDGLVTERAAGDGDRGPEGGRPPVLVALAPSAGALLALDFGHDRVRVAVSDLAYTVLAEDVREVDIDERARESMDLAAELVDRLLAEAGMDRSGVLSAGVGLPGPIDPRTGLVRSTSILPSWTDLDPRAELEARLGSPVHLDNDANVGALGEWVFGAARGHDVVAYVRLSAGIGLGLVLEGRPFRGAAGVAGELGHVLVDPGGTICRCGNRGCLETFASGGALVDLVRRSHGELTVEQLLALAAEGDRGCQRAVQDAARVVGRALADLCNYLNPDVVVVGGDLSAAGELLLAPLEAAIRQYAIPAAAETVSVVQGSLGGRAEVLGALALAGQEAEGVLSDVPQLMHQRGRS